MKTHLLHHCQDRPRAVSLSIGSIDQKNIGNDYEVIAVNTDVDENSFGSENQFEVDEEFSDETPPTLRNAEKENQKMKAKVADAKAKQKNPIQASSHLVPQEVPGELIKKNNDTSNIGIIITKNINDTLSCSLLN